MFRAIFARRFRRRGTYALLPSPFLPNVLPSGMSRTTRREPHGALLAKNYELARHRRDYLNCRPFFELEYTFEATAKAGSPRQERKASITRRIIRNDDGVLGHPPRTSGEGRRAANRPWGSICLRRCLWQRNFCGPSQADDLRGSSGLHSAG